MTAEIVMIDGARFVTIPSTAAETLIEGFERRSFVQIELDEGPVFLNPAHVAYVRDLRESDQDSTGSQ